jgi:glycosyl hydrolase family 1
MGQCEDQKAAADAARKEWYAGQTQTCVKEEDKGHSQCSEQRDLSYSKCTEERDMGYSTCSERRDEGYSQCCTWFPCSLACKVVVWVSNIVCVAWSWASNVVCVATAWVENIVCDATVWVSKVECVAWAAVENAAGAAGSLLEWAACKVPGPEVGSASSPLEPDDTLPDISGVTFDDIGDDGSVRPFLWGVATAAYQVEGHEGPQEMDGHPEDWESDWDIFTTSTAIRERVRDAVELGGTTTSLGGAIRHAEMKIDLQPPQSAVRHSKKEVLVADLERAKLLGLNSYRFSIEWSRVQPKRPAENEPEFLESNLRYYDEVFEEVRRRGLEPIVTLNHLTLPSWLLSPPKGRGPLLPTPEPDDDFNQAQGWEQDETVIRFVRYVAFIVGRYSWVKHWITLNEPVGSTIGLGYLAGIWSPGWTVNADRAKRAYENILRAHFKAYKTIKKISPEAQVGIAHAMMYARETGVSRDRPGRRRRPGSGGRSRERQCRGPEPVRLLLQLSPPQCAGEGRSRPKVPAST